MPVYLRKNVVFTPPSLENVSDEDEDDYIQDPEQIRDNLPQPYRMIDKLVSVIYDDAWEVIAYKENARIAEQSKIRPPKYDCAAEIQNQVHNKATALTGSVDGRYVFIGLPNGLAVIDALTQRPVTQWEEDGMDITGIKAHVMGVQTYLLVLMDDMGTARLFAFAFDCLFMLKVLNEQEGGVKNLVTKCEASTEGDYVGMVLENTSNKETWLEIHKLPRDAWLRELESIQAQLQPKEDQSGEIQVTESQVIDSGDTNQTAKQIHEKSRNSSASSRKSSASDKQRKNKRSKSRKDGSAERSGSPKPGTPPPMTGNPGDKVAYKFTPPTLVLRVNPPTPTKANPLTGTFAACQKVDSGEVVGTGQTHLLTSTHLEGRDAMFDHLHEGLVKYLPKDKNDEDSVVMACFHFLPAGRMVPLGLEQPSQAGLPTTVAVWWTGASHIMHYSLLKTAKEVDHKPDVVWPFTCKIQCTAASSCGVLLAIGMTSGNVILWDRYLGINKGVIRVSETHPVTCVKFLDPSILPPTSQGYPPYRKKTSISLLIQCRDGSEYVYNTAEGPHSHPVCISGVPEKDDEVETILDAMPDVPELVLVVQRSGSLILKDVLTGSNLCQMDLPSTHQLTNTWDPTLTFGAGGQFLYVKGVKTSSDETAEAEDGVTASTSQSSLFMFQLRSFPTLDLYWQREREKVKYLVHTTMEDRLDALMKERLAQQALRKPRMQQRWGMLRQELELIHQARDMAKKRAKSRVLLSASTYKSGVSMFS